MRQRSGPRLTSLIQHKKKMESSSQTNEEGVCLTTPPGHPEPRFLSRTRISAPPLRARHAPRPYHAKPRCSDGGSAFRQYILRCFTAFSMTTERRTPHHTRPLPHTSSHPEPRRVGGRISAPPLRARHAPRPYHAKPRCSDGGSAFRQYILRCFTAFSMTITNGQSRHKKKQLTSRRVRLQR